MTKEELVDAIITNYHPLSEDCRAEMIEHSTRLETKKGELLVKEGQRSNTIFFLGSGSARAYYHKDARDVTDWFAFENSFITAIVSFFYQVPSPHYIEIIESGYILALDRQVSEELMDRHRDYDRLSKQVITETMLQLQQRVVSLQFETAKQSYENLLKVRPDITQRVPLSYIASYLGITLETLSRIRKPPG